jgi:uncharacterized membrane protein
MDLPFDLNIPFEFDFDIETLKSLITDFDLMALLPDLADLMGWLVTAVEYSLVIGPMVLVALGLLYLLLPTKEANYVVGYRFFWGMGSIQSWRFTQRLAGAVWTVMGLLLVKEANEFRETLVSLENLDMMYQSVMLLLRQVYYVVVSCLGINLLVFLIFNFRGEVRWLWKMVGRFFVWVGKSIANAVGSAVANLLPKKEKTEKTPKEKRPRRVAGQKQDTPNPPEA